MLYLLSARALAFRGPIVNRAALIILLLGWAFSACDSETTSTREAPLGFEVVAPADRGAALSLAAQDIVDAWVTVKGLAATDEAIRDSLSDAVAKTLIVITLDDANEALSSAALSDQSYIIAPRDFGQGRSGLEITARNELAASYALYDIAAEMGVLYYHPKDTFFPNTPELELPVAAYDGSVSTPSFELRGFHEHTQHPTPASDFFMRTDDPSFRAEASEMLQWMLRNRQNVLTIKLLKTIDVETWVPYMAEISAEAKDLGVIMGTVVSFADQQQNSFKLIDDERPEDEQIREDLDMLLEAGMGMLTLQIGTSEFTKPSDAQALGWIETARTHLAENAPDVHYFNWIHTTCSLEDDNGGYYFHLPLQSDEGVGAWVHTTMYYTLTDPAPVYDCESFEQQVDFMRQAGARDLVYFPETAWWLGFDNNMPLTLPITGHSRAYDIQQVLPEFDMQGHITFTSGREWNYWQYDHHLMRITWDADFGWDDYLAWIAPMYGESAQAATEAQTAMTARQVQDFYLTNPLIFFYLAGELPQDEVGEQAGILARRPKRSFKSIGELDDAAFTQWKTDDYDLLVEMLAAYQAILDDMPAELTTGTDQQQALFEELRVSYEVYVQRIEHAITLYTGVMEARAWLIESREAAPDTTVRDSAKAAAEAKLAEARAISEAVEIQLKAMEENYRYSTDLLARAKPESLTSYPYGYLEQTSTAFFWHRRDVQLERYIARVFDESNDAFVTEPDILFYTNASLSKLTTPDDPIASSVIASFVPQLLFGLIDYDDTTRAMGVIIAQDANENFLPDEATGEDRLDGTVSAEGVWSGATDTFPITVRDTSDVVLGTLTLQSATLTLDVTIDNARPTNLTTGTLAGQVASANLLEIVLGVPGIDEEGATNLLKSIYGVPAEDPLPELLDVAFAFTFRNAAG